MTFTPLNHFKADMQICWNKNLKNGKLAFSSSADVHVSTAGNVAVATCKEATPACSAQRCNATCQSCVPAWQLACSMLRREWGECMGWIMSQCKRWLCTTEDAMVLPRETRLGNLNKQLLGHFRKDISENIFFEKMVCGWLGQQQYFGFVYCREVFFSQTHPASLIWSRFSYTGGNVGIKWVPGLWRWTSATLCVRCCWEFRSQQ